jgi:protein-tyrosine sulfotransferase
MRESAPAPADAAPGPAARERWPVFVLSCHRSGSTLLREVLAPHPRLACAPESGFIAGLQPFLDYPQALAALGTLGWQPDRVIRELRAMVERLMARHMHPLGKERWVDTTPGYVRHTALIDRLFDGEVLYVLFVRHPLDCVHALHASVVPSTRHGDPEIARCARQFGVGRHAWAQYWSEVHTRLAAFAASCLERTVVIRYEDLLSAPADVLRSMLTAIGERCPADLIAHASVRTSRIGARRSAAGDRTAADPWRAWPAAEIRALWSTVERVAEPLGYRGEP